MRQKAPCTRGKDLTGKRFGRLVAIEISGKDSINAVLWHCICDCGNTCRTRTASLLSGKTKSCGCISVEQLKKTSYKTRVE